MSETKTMDPEACMETAGRIEAAVGAVLLGQPGLLREAMITLLAGGHALLEGVPGLGKTLLVRSLAAATGADFKRIQFTPDLMPADIVGTNIIAEDESGRREWRYQPGPVFANLLLADEINRATPKTQSALLEAMEERSVTVAGHTRALPQPFSVLATQNPLEMEGTYPLPEAQLDRFLLHLRVPFPDRATLVAIATQTTGPEMAPAEQVCDVQTLAAMQRLCRTLPIAPHLIDMAAALVLATHPEHESAPERVRRFVAHGASPRAVQALVLAGKARALMEGRFNVSAGDLRALAPAVLRHRMVAGYEARAEGIDMDALAREAIAAVGDDAGGSGA
jgi:MoxR-like ATPase